MQPNSDHRRGLQVPSSRGNVAPPTSRDAAVTIMRDQINKLYDEPQPNEQIAMQVPDEPVAMAATTDIPDDSTYAKTHSNQTDVTAAGQDTDVQQYWQKYHSAWQYYYQQYYERYYQTQVTAHEQRVAVKQQVAEADTDTTAQTPETPQELTKDQAVEELRGELMSKVKSRTERIKKSRHFRPAIIALIVMISALVLQYNQLIVANVMAFTVPSSTQKLDAYNDPSSELTVGPESRLIMPSINVDAPIDFSLTTLNESVVDAKLKNGVVHYPIPGANAAPGQVGNSVILGHSSNDVFDDGNYKFIFLYLDRLQKGDTFYINYNSKRYTYSVTEKKVINPNQVSELAITTTKPMVTLVTCTPVGTAQQRLLVFAEQISPDPSGATETAPQSSTSAPQEIGGATSGFFDRLFQ